VTRSSREFPERPIVGVGAVVIDEDRVLLVRRANEPLKGEWSLPGGAVELGETMRDAIAREVLEETGLAVDVGPVVDVLDRIRVDDDQRVRFHYVLVDFVCRRASGALSCASDAEEARWARLDDLPDYHVADATVVVIREAFRIRGGCARLDDPRGPVGSEKPGE
jgi:8-oxo-dGTP diphosphatase